MCFSACTDNAIESIASSNEASEDFIRLCATAGETGTRVSVNDNHTSFSYNWEADDTFTVIDSNNKETVFKIDAGGAGTNVATFTSVAPSAFKNGENLYAFYNGNQPIEYDKNGNIVLDISQQDGTLTDKYQYLLGETTYDVIGNNGFVMNHLVATLKLNITLPSELKSISNIQIGTPDGYWYNGDYLTPKATLVLNNALNDSEGMFSRGDVVFNRSHNQVANGTLTINGVFKPQADNVVTVYVYMLPAKHYWDNENWSNDAFLSSTIYIKEGDKEYAGSIDYSTRNFFPGDVYEMNTKLYQLEDFANQSTADGTLALPYEISNARQLYTFMFRNSRNFHNGKNLYYRQCNFYLSNDITLDDEMAWAPCYLLDHNTFDGRDHEIKGNLRLCGPLFDRVDQQSTLKNVILNANISFGDYFSGNSALFASRVAYRSTIEHCINKSDIILDRFWFYDGFPIIAHEVLDEARIIASGNEGRVLFNGSNFTGSLVYTLNGTMDLCYNKGEIVPANGNGSIGGLVGKGDVLKNCWSVGIVQPQQGSFITMYGLAISASSITNCYWNADFAKEITEGNSGNYQNCGTFSGKCPTPAQIDALNREAASTGYVFDATGSLIKNDKNYVRPSEIIEWK